MKSSKYEKGQAIIIIAFAIVVLVGFAALAIDGGRVLSDRRHAQNAADTAAFAGALAIVHGEDYTVAAEDRADTNGYDNNGTSNIVEVHLCSDTGVTCNLPTGAIASHYIQVKITSQVNTVFARVLGIHQITNRVQAVARATPPVITTWFNGRAMVSTMKGCKGDNPGDINVPFTVGGNGTTIVNNSGIFVNSACPAAFVDNGSANLVTTTAGVCIVGGIGSSVNGVTPPPQGGCETQKNIEDFVMPDPEKYCTSPGSITGSGGVYTATPGYYDKTGNKTFPDASPAGTLYLQKGVYCLYNGISLNSNWTITTDIGGNPGHDSATEGVLFYVPDGDVTFNGGSTLNLHAIDSADYPNTIQKYLFYVPLSNKANVTITGNNGSGYTGAVLAPGSHCTVSGSGNTIALDSQLICYDTTITGGGQINITYTPENNPPAIFKPTIQMEQ